ncbi:Putative GTP cyclohydrolase 1 type 2, NIF3 family [Verrucomicrobium sp. GAS474]|uniref:Nif3-like dinuclear metal center hexameric protein n=1 Tax=Verrucomicrobium sp. GAS474 TaxID=1882831 RepID=UPI00087987E7|nr:Nif3-like dinuclear metal center hexameric protein [Verrucomicrobium sp. GAS474]SDU02929.1 Putative GTP cyclohydrolase 1 type 2, NIF3 family [Verrucomicrobium sp. GAS474]
MHDSLLHAGIPSPLPSSLRARDVVEAILRELPPLPSATCDRFQAGDPAWLVTGVAVTFMATRAVLERAVALGANLVITHEPTFYNHHDETEWIGDDPVYRSKASFLREHELILWRCHDGPHLRRPDLIVEGMSRRFGWTLAAGEDFVCDIPPRSLRALAATCRQILRCGPIRVAGELEMLCRRVALLPGAWGGRKQIAFLRRDDVDVVLCGESPEWETCEYVRDAPAAERAKGLIVLGHANSEEPGMERTVEWMRALLPASLPVFHLPAGDPFRTV